MFSYKGAKMGKRKEDRVIDLIKKENVRIINRMAISVTFIELVILFVAFVSRNPRIYNKASLVSVAIGFVVNLVMALVTQYLRKKDSSAFIGVIGFVYYVILSYWGIMVSYRHYVKGEMIITFFIVQVGFACFVAIVPIIGMLIYPLSFVIFYVLMYQVDGGQATNAINYFAFAVVLVLASLERYNMEYRTFKQKLEIMKLLRFDRLTGLLNRYAFDEILEDIKNKRVSIGMSDMDNFKHINDVYGHVVGDKVLRQVSKLLLEDEPEIWCFRYGGDEFMFITDRSEEYLREVLEQWSKKIEETKFDDVEEKISVSIGVTTGVVRDADSVRELVKVADSELYTRKKSKL